MTMGGLAYHHVEKASAFTSINIRGTTYHHVRKDTTLTSMTMGGPTYHHVEKDYVNIHLPDSSLPLGRKLDLENTKLLPEVLKLHSG